MHKPAILLALIACLVGCGTSPQKPDSAGGSSSGKNCELKNPTGTGSCEDGRGAKASASSASTGRGRPFKPSDCTTYGPGAYVLLAELSHRMTEWKAYCREQQAGSSSDVTSSRQNAAIEDLETGGETDTGGTWYCDTVDGSGMYGRYGMRNLPNIVASTCKRVGN